jgi:hypothetical protein
MPNDGGLVPQVLPPFRLRAVAPAAPAGWPPDVSPNQVIASGHINNIRSSVYAWPGDVDGQNHTLSNVHLVNATGVLADPTTAAGDLIARGAAAIGRLPIGSAGQVLTVDAAQPQMMRWTALPAAPVASVFGRVGAVIAQAGDYTAAQITGALADPMTTKGDLIARGATAAGRVAIGADGQVLQADSAAALGVKWAAPAVSSVFGRTGAVIPQAGDYTAMQVTNAVSTVGSYPDPPWIPNYSYSKLIGVPTSFPASPHTHDAGAIVSGVLSTARLGTGVADQTVYLRGDGTWAGVAGGGGGGAVISVFGRAGNVIAQSGDYTAAMVTGAVTDPTTQVGDLIVRNNVNALTRLPIGANGQVLQADLSLSVGMKWTSIEATVQTPWVTDVNAANFQLVNVRRVGVGVAAPNYGIDVAGDINYTGVLRVNGTPVSFGGAQTPWTSDINAASFRLYNAGSIGIGVAPPQSAPLQVASHTPGSTGSIAVQDLDATASGNPVLLVSGISSEGTRCWALGNRGGATFGQNFYLWNDRSSDILIGTNSTERVRVTAAGNVGIGTTNPTALLGMLGGNLATSAGSIISMATLQFSDPNGDQLKVYGYRNVAGSDWNTAEWRIQHQVDASAMGWLGFPAQDCTIGTGAAERMRITAGGNIGIGTANPGGKLEIFGVGGTPGTGANILRLMRSGGSVVLDCGNYTTNPFGMWIQAYDQSSAAITYPLCLQPVGGSVGIGNPNPATLLHVYKRQDGAVTAITVDNDGGTGGVGQAVRFAYGATGFLGGIYHSLDASVGWCLRLKVWNNSAEVERVTIQGNTGNVGIGITNPTRLLQMVSAAGVPTQFNLTQSGTSSWDIQIPAGQNALTFVDTGTGEKMRITATGAVGIGTGSNVPDTLTVGGNAQIRIVAGNYGAIFYNNTAELYFLVTNSGDPYGGFNSLRPLSYNFSNGAVTMAHALSVGAGINVTGNVNVTGGYYVNGSPFTSGITGVTVQRGNVTIATRPTINYFAGTGTDVSVTDDPGGNRVNIQTNQTSDLRLKQNVVDLTGGLSIINALRPVAFEYNGARGFTAGRRSASIIAQELQQVLPDSVYSYRGKLRPDDEEDTDILCWEPNQILVHVVLAVKQLDERLKALEGKVN